MSSRIPKRAIVFAMLIMCAILLGFVASIRDPLGTRRASLQGGSNSVDTIGMEDSSTQDPSYATESVVLATYRALNPNFEHERGDVVTMPKSTQYARETEHAILLLTTTPTVHIGIRAAATPTAPYPLPLSREDAIAWAMSIAPPERQPHDAVARLVTQSTLASFLGYDAGLDATTRVWIVAVKTAGSNEYDLGRQAGFDPSSLITGTPRPVDGYVIAFSVNGEDLGGGSLFPESVDTNQSYAAIVNLKEESD